MKQGRPQPKRMAVMVDVWRCEDLKTLIKESIDAHVKDVQLATRLEHSLAQEIAYNDGGGGNVAVT